MKKNNILKLFVGFALFASGAFAVGSALSNKKDIKPVSASGETKRVYIDYNGIYFAGDTYLHYWGGLNGSEWPGVKLDTDNNKIDKESIILANRDHLNRDLFYWDIPSDTTTGIFTINGQDWNRWDNFDISSHNLFQMQAEDEYYQSFDVVQITLERADSSVITEYHIPAWSGVGYTAPTVTSGYRWVIDSTSAVFNDETVLTSDIVLREEALPVTEYTVNFYLEDKTTLYDSVSVLEGDTAACSKENPTKASEGAKYYTFAGWVDDNGDAAALTNIHANMDVYASFSEAYQNGRYVVGDFGGGSWDVEHASLLEYDGEKHEYHGTVTLEYLDEFEIAWYNGSSFESYFGFDDLISTCGALFCFDRVTNEGHPEDGNFKCYAGGTYDIYFIDPAYGYYSDYKHVSIELHDNVWGAETLAARLMNYSDDSGTCQDRFPEMNQKFLSLSEAEQNKFKGYENSNVDQFKNAYDRYTTWASILKLDPWTSHSQAELSRAINSVDSSTTISIITIVALTSVSLIGVCLVIKKRKVNN